MKNNLVAATYDLRRPFLLAAILCSIGLRLYANEQQSAQSAIGTEGIRDPGKCRPGTHCGGEN